MAVVGVELVVLAGNTSKDDEADGHNHHSQGKFCRVSEEVEHCCPFLVGILGLCQFD